MCTYPGHVVVGYVRSHVNDSCIIQNGILSLENITIVRSQIKVELTMALDSLYTLMRVGLYLPVFTKTLYWLLLMLTLLLFLSAL